MDVAVTSNRWELYRLLSEPVRLRLLALAADEELTIGELADLLGESQPTVSRHASAMRQFGLLGMRREGTRTLVRLATEQHRDPVVRDALESGRTLVEADGSRARIGDLIRARDAATREFFSREPRASAAPPPMSDVSAYLFALAPLLPRRSLAVDAGTGDGALLEVLGPLFDKVVAVDRSEVQLGRAKERMAARGIKNVSFVQAELDSAAVRKEVAGGADVVVASRILHHATRPQAALSDLSALAKPGGAVLVIDYSAHEDESMREQADVWLGFQPAELLRLAKGAGIERAQITRVPDAFRGRGPDAHLSWILLVGQRGGETSPNGVDDKV